MIHEIYDQLRVALKAKGVPFECVYGPTPVPAKVGATRIHMLRDYDAGDQVLPTLSQHRNPRVFAARGMGALVRVHAQSTIGGAQRHDHERLADAIVDQVQVELYKIVRAAKTVWRVTRAGLVADATTDGWAGVVYELHFQIDRGVRDVDWLGNADGEMTMTSETAVTSLAATGPATGPGLPTATTRIEP